MVLIEYVVLCCFSTDTVRCQAPPLTVETVFEAVKGLPWRDLGGGLLGWRSDKLDTIRHQHGSDDEACLKAVIEAFLRGEGHYRPSWGRVIHALYHVRETHIAQDIISYAEPVEGERLRE